MRVSPLILTTALGRSLLFKSNMRTTPFPKGKILGGEDVLCEVTLLPGFLICKAYPILPDVS